MNNIDDSKRYLNGEICIICNKKNDNTSREDHDHFLVHSKCMGEYILIYESNEEEKSLHGYNTYEEAEEDAEQLNVKYYSIRKRVE